MKTPKADLILHPARMRIIGLLVGGRHLTPQQMAERLSNVPLPSLYRHLGKLVAGGILTVAEERRVRGAVERVYRLSERQADLTEKDLAQASREDHMRYFMTFMASLLDDFARYLEQDTIDLVRDGVGYRQAPLYLSDEELRQVALEIGAVLTRAMANEPAPERRRRTLSTIVLPEPAAPVAPAPEE